MTNKSVLVIVVTYNGTKWINRCFDSVKNSLQSATLFVVDNKSTDDTVDIIKSEYPEVILIESDKNLGFGGANNIGLEYAIENNFDYVYLLNQDAWVMPDTIGKLIEVNIKNPQFGVLSPLQTNAKMDSLDVNFASCLSMNREVVSDYIFGSVKELYQTKFTMAAHWLISRECLLKTGLFSPIFFHYGEDDNFIHRTQYFGYKNGVVTTAKAVHDREFRETPKSKELYMSSVLFLIHFSNINHSFCEALLRTMFVVVKDLLHKTAKYKDFTIPFRLFPMLLNIPKIYKNRKRNRCIYKA